MEPEFAPQYSTGERWRLGALYVVLGIAVYGASKLWLAPHFQRFAQSPQCVAVFGISRAAVLVYGAFVGIPLLTALVLGVLTSRISVRAIRARQYPPPGQKVLHRTRIRKGRSAIALACLPIMTAALLCGAAVWGAFQARNLIDHLRGSGFKERVCAPAGHGATGR